MMNKLFKSFMLSAVLQVVLCSGHSFDDVNIIRIQNNGSETRTIYLPKHNVTSSERSLKYYKKISNEIDGNKFVLVDHFGSHSSHIKNNVQLTQKQTNKDGTAHNVKIMKSKAKIQKHNTTDPYKLHFSIKKRNKTISTNNTVQPTKKSGIEIKVGADKIAKRKYALYTYHPTLQYSLNITFFPPFLAVMILRPCKHY